MSEDAPSDGIDRSDSDMDPGTKDSGAGLEQRRIDAEGIYAKLQAARGKASLKAFGKGEVLFADSKRRVMVAALGNTAEWSTNERDQFLGRGFTNEDIDSGLITVIDREFRNPNWPAESFQPEPTVAYINISGTGKVIGGGPDAIGTQGFGIMKLEAHQREAIQTVADLSAIPYQIREQFGSYEEFLKSLGSPDMKGIDSVEYNPSGIVYAAGLKEFVRALELQKSGELDKLDTGSHALKKSLDPTNHLTQTLEAVRKYEIKMLEDKLAMPAAPDPQDNSQN